MNGKKVSNNTAFFLAWRFIQNDLGSSVKKHAPTTVKEITSWILGLRLWNFLCPQSKHCSALVRKLAWYTFVCFLLIRHFLVYKGGYHLKPLQKKKKKLKFKLDLRLVVFNNKVIVDGMSGEISKKATNQKLYNNNLKSMLASNCHAINFLKSIPFVTTADVKKIRFPIIQTMGLDVHVYIIRLVHCGPYVLDDAFIFLFPSNLKSLRTETKRLSDGLCLVEVRSKYILNAYRRTIDNKSIINAILRRWLKTWIWFMKQIKLTPMMP